MSSFKARLIVLTLGGLLAGCVASAPLEAPLSTDLVKDEATAIRLGQEACVNVQYLERAQKEGGWHAELQKAFGALGRKPAYASHSAPVSAPRPVRVMVLVLSA